MRKFWFAAILGLALAPGLVLVGPGTALAQGAGGQAVVCAKSLQFSLPATSITRIVTGVSGQSIHLCGFTLNAGAATATYKLTIGTGTNCNANALDITPAFSLGINGVLAMQNGFAWFSTPPSVGGVPYDLCHTSTGTGPMQVLLQYHQS